MPTKTTVFKTSLDPVLGPVLHRYSAPDSPPRSAALAVLARAYGTDGSPLASPSLTRRWLLSRTPTGSPIHTLAASDHAWSPLVAAARRYHLQAARRRSSQSSSTPSPASIAVARRLTGWLGSPVVVDVVWRSWVRARLAHV